MTILLTLLALSAPIWTPLLVTGLYAFGVRRLLPMKVRTITDKLYWGVYFALWGLAVLAFITEIFGWQLAPLYQWLWLFGLGLPMAVLMFVIFMSSLMASDSW